MKTSTAIQKQGKISPILGILNSGAIVAKFCGLENILSKIILIMVRLYQRYISPYKGFNCPHNQLHHQQSCSSFFFTCIKQYDLVTANSLLQQRLIDCRQAYEILTTDSSYQNSQRRRKKSSECGSCWDLIDLSYLFSSCGDDNCESCELGDCDLGGCDLS